MEARLRFPSHVCRARGRCAPEYVGDCCTAPPTALQAKPSAHAPEILFMRSLNLTSTKIQVRRCSRPSHGYYLFIALCTFLRN